MAIEDCCSPRGIKNISAVVKRDLCHGCGACVGVCPSDAILIQRKSGVYVPVVDESRCYSRPACTLCFKVCPGRSIRIDQISDYQYPNSEKDAVLGRYLHCHVGFSTDPTIRYHSASGGLVTQLLTYMLEEKLIDKALVTRMSKTNPFEPETILTDDISQIIEAQSSKYCPVSICDRIKDMMRAKERYAVVGLPCHLHGFRKAEELLPKLKEKVVLYLGIYCSTTQRFEATDYTLFSHRIKKERVDKITYRDEGYFGNMLIKSADCIKRIPYKDYNQPLRSFFIPYRCTLCIDHSAELSDVSFGDINIPEFRNEKIGISSAIVRSQRGVEVLDRALRAKKIDLKEIEKDKIVESQKASLERKKKHTWVRLRMLQCLGRTIPEYDQKYEPLSVRRKVKYLMAALVLYSELFIGKRRYLWWVINMFAKYGKVPMRADARRGTSGVQKGVVRGKS